MPVLLKVVMNLVSGLPQYLLETNVKIIFWNVKKRQGSELIASLISTYQCDIAVFAEYDDDDVDVLKELLSQGLAYYALPTIGCDRIKVFSNRKLSDFTIKRESARYSFREFKCAGMIPVLFCMVHLPSKLHMEEVDQAMAGVYFKQDVEEAEEDVGHRNTVIFGDFNMNPYDSGMYLANAMNSVSCRKLALSMSRMIDEREFSYFYNPSWSLLGDREGVPGSYYYSGGSYSKSHWNLLDQVIIRPELIDRFDLGSLNIITEIGGVSLIGYSNRPKLSDHLPIFFSLKLQHEVSNEKLMA